MWPFDFKQAVKDKAGQWLPRAWRWWEREMEHDYQWDVVSLGGVESDLNFIVSVLAHTCECTENH